MEIERERMAKNGGDHADVEIRIEGEWEAGRETGRSRTDNISHHPHRQQQQQQNPIPSPITTTTSTPTTRISQIAPTQGVAAIVGQKPADRSFSSKLWKLLFFAHLTIISVLITFLAIRGFLARNHRFRHLHWYIPLLTSSSCSAPVALAWLFATHRRPPKAIKASLWLSPLLTCAASVLLFDTGKGVGLAFAVPGLVFALVQSLYACWVTPRLHHAGQILAASLSATRTAAVGITKFVVIALVAGVAYSCIWILGVGGIAADRPRFAALYILVLSLSLAWTMQVIGNILHVAISGYAYMHLARGVDIDPAEAFRNACTYSMGSICLGSAVVPVIGAFRGMARTMNLVAGDTDEFLFSCSNCCMGIADRLVAYGNRWGFVRVGVYAKGFVAASSETWESFARLRMEPAIDSDFTSSFCFLTGVAGGALSALVAGIWVLVVDKSYVTAVSLYAFFIGYFMNRISMSWPQACVSSYYVAYAENPQSQQFGSPMTNRIRALQRS